MIVSYRLHRMALLSAGLGRRAGVRELQVHRNSLGLSRVIRLARRKKMMATIRCKKMLAW